MFHLGNGIWISLEHIISVSVEPAVPGDADLGYDAVVADSRREWRFGMEDMHLWTTGGGTKVVPGLRSRGYETPQAFCEEILAAIKAAKNG